MIYESILSFGNYRTHLKDDTKISVVVVVVVVFVTYTKVYYFKFLLCGNNMTGRSQRKHKCVMGGN